MNDFEEIYRNYYQPVYFYLLDLCGNPDIAEEITQAAFFKVLNKIDSFKGECSISSWIIEIAKNTYFDYCRKSKRIGNNFESTVKMQPNSTNENLPEKTFISKEMEIEIHLALHKLTEPYKEVFWMRTFGELSFKEISTILGKTESWARVTYHRARLMIKENVENEKQM